MVIFNIIAWIVGISFILLLFSIAYKAAVEDGTPGCLYVLIAAVIITIITLVAS